MRRRKKVFQEESGLDLTPMLDIVFIMLIFFASCEDELNKYPNLVLVLKTKYSNKFIIERRKK